MLRASASQKRCCLGLVSTRQDKTASRQRFDAGLVSTRRDISSRDACREAGRELARRRARPTWCADGVTPTRRPASGRRNYDVIIFFLNSKNSNLIKKKFNGQMTVASNGRIFIYFFFSFIIL